MLFYAAVLIKIYVSSHTAEKKHQSLRISLGTEASENERTHRLWRHHVRTNQNQTFDLPIQRRVPQQKMLT